MKKKNHSMTLTRTGISCVLVALLGSVALTACGGDDSSTTPATPTPTALKTLDGNTPLVIGHRGLPGLYPEETQVSYEAAADAGADSLEEDLHLSKDCVLVVRHNPWLSDNTNVADVAKTNADVASRQRTMHGGRVPVKWTTTATTGPSTYLS